MRNSIVTQILCRDTKQRSRKKLSHDKEFDVATYYSSIQAARYSGIVATREALSLHKPNNIRRTMSRQNSRREHKNMSRQKLHATTKYWVTEMKTLSRQNFLCRDKVTNWAIIFGDPQLVPRSAVHHLKIYGATSAKPRTFG